MITKAEVKRLIATSRRNQSGSFNKELNRMRLEIVDLFERMKRLETKLRLY